MFSMESLGSDVLSRIFRLFEYNELLNCLLMSRSINRFIMTTASIWPTVHVNECMVAYSLVNAARWAYMNIETNLLDEDDVGRLSVRFPSVSVEIFEGFVEISEHDRGFRGLSEFAMQPDNSKCKERAFPHTVLKKGQRPPHMRCLSYPVADLVDAFRQLLLNVMRRFQMAKFHFTSQFPPELSDCLIECITATRRFRTEPPLVTAETTDPPTNRVVRAFGSTIVEICPRRGAVEKHLFHMDMDNVKITIKYEWLASLQGVAVVLEFQEWQRGERNVLDLRIESVWRPQWTITMDDWDRLVDRLDTTRMAITTKTKSSLLVHLKRHCDARILRLFYDHVANHKTQLLIYEVPYSSFKASSCDN